MNNPINYSTTYRIPACWEPCDAVVLVWPDKGAAVEMLEFYEALSSVLPDYANVLILVGEGQSISIKQHIESLGAETKYIFFYEVAHQIARQTTHDVIVGDIGNWGPLFIESSEGFFFFLRKGEDSNFFLSAKTLFPYADIRLVDFQIERGMLETNGGSQLLLNKTRWIEKNSDIEFIPFIDFLQKSCGISNVITLDAPPSVQYLPVRLGPGTQLIMTVCDDENSKYYKEFDQLHIQLQQSLNSMGAQYDIINLPWVGELEDDQGQYYFADYSQYLILNETILLPIFDLPTDEDAMEILSQVFIGFDILGFPSSALAVANTNLMKIHLPMPEGVLEPL